MRLPWPAAAFSLARLRRFVLCLWLRKKTKWATASWTIDFILKQPANKQIKESSAS
jgi:hypothetical protein